MVPDDIYGASLAVEHLIHLGHRSIAHISGLENWHNSKERLEGYKKTLEKYGIAFVEEWIQPGDWEIEGGYRGAQSLLQLPNRPTAIFAANDLMALGAIYAIQDAGLSVPHDIAVVGYDNREFTWIARPNITTVVMPVYEMGRIAAEILLQQIADGTRENEEVKVKGELIVRDTCGANESQKTNRHFERNTSLRRVSCTKTRKIKSGIWVFAGCRKCPNFDSSEDEPGNRIRYERSLCGAGCAANTQISFSFRSRDKAGI